MSKSNVMVMGPEFQNDMTPIAVPMYSEFKTKSAQIRARAKDGQSRADIAKAMGIRYQHVRNVLLTPLKK
jgi:hypothetical protein